MNQSKNISLLNHENLKVLKTFPAVFAVGNHYQIMVTVERESLVSVKIDEKIYFDESNGVRNSLLPLHRITVPMETLDSAREYTVCIRPVLERIPYFTKTGKPVELKFNFNPIPERKIRAYHISDAHDQIELPIKAAKTFGNIDFLILNGDIIDHCEDSKNFENIYEICALLTGGAIPVLFSRGNHDMRGGFAEKFTDYTPNRSGSTYYTFRLGSIWGMVIDCGEDKNDSHEAYGFTVACHNFRERQTEYIKAVIENAQREYDAPGIKTRLVISHTPFTQRLAPPFDIEEKIYREWARLLREHIKPDLMICGHTHKHGIHFVGGVNDHYGQPCTLVVASEPQSERFIGCGFVIDDNQIEAVFTDSQRNMISSEVINKQTNR